MTAAIEAKAYLYDLIRDLFANDNTIKVVYGPNDQFVGYTVIQVMNISWESTSVNIGEAEGNRREDFTINVSIGATRKNGDLANTDAIVLGLYHQIDRAINADHNLGGLVNNGSLCIPGDLESWRETEGNFSMLVFAVTCSHGLF